MEEGDGGGPKVSMLNELYSNPMFNEIYRNPRVCITLYSFAIGKEKRQEYDD